MKSCLLLIETTILWTDYCTMLPLKQTQINQRAVKYCLK